VVKLEQARKQLASEGEVSPSSSLNPPILKQLLLQMFKWKIIIRNNLIITNSKNYFNNKKESNEK
jgi:hypothetical protein